MEWLFALRYLISRKSHSVINIIAGVSLASVAVPVAAMVILLSVFNGFETLVRQMYAAVDADIEIRAAQGGTRDEALRATGENRRRMEECEGVEAVSFVIERQALLEYGGREVVSRVRGTDAHYADAVPVGGHVAPQGISAYDAADGAAPSDWAALLGSGGVILGEGVAYALGIPLYGTRLSGEAGERVCIVEAYPPGGGEVGSLLPLSGMRHVGLTVRGTFAIDSTTDADLVLTSLGAADVLFSAGGYADAALVRVGAGHSPDAVRRRLAAALGKGVKISTREEKNSAFYRIMRYEKRVVFLISLLVLVIASFSVIGTVVMLIVEKRGERTVLRALGADSGFIRRIFIREGLLISGIGGAVGMAFGTALAAVQQYLHVIPMPAGAFLVESYPVELHLTDIITVTLTFIAVAWGISYAATRAMIKSEKPCDAQS